MGRGSGGRTQGLGLKGDGQGSSREGMADPEWQL